jgi:hypothetical protein
MLTAAGRYAAQDLRRTASRDGRLGSSNAF